MVSKWLKEQWIARNKTALSLRFPDRPIEQIESFLEKKFDETYTDHDAVIFNSYENMTFQTSLGETVDWIQSFKPLIAESGVFFYPKHIKRNLNTEIIKECMLDIRDIHKKEKFAALDAGDTFLAAVKDIQQVNDKKAANSGYGAEGQRSSFLFNMNSAMSVTSCGRGQLSTASQCIENFLGDFVKFFNMGEFYIFIGHIINEQPEWKFKYTKYVDEVPSKEKFIKRFLNKFLHISFADKEAIGAVYDGLSDELRCRLYYKTNMYEFFRNSAVKRLAEKVMCKNCKFIDPNKVPDKIKENIELLSDVILEFVGYRYGVFRYEDRTRYQKRSIIPVSDTDS